MKLTNEGIKDRAAWEAKGYALPAFDRDAMCKKTKESPVWAPAISSAPSTAPLPRSF